MNSEALLSVLDEQSSMGFTGKVNILQAQNSQSYAVILMLEGKVINCLSATRSGEKALLDMVFEDVSNSKKFKIVVEPELVTAAEGQLDLSVDALKKKARHLYENYLNAKKLRPKQELKLILNPDFIIAGEDIGPDEFDVLSTISDYSRVRDIYDHCPLMEYEVTRALVSLRRKGALKVMA